jgi:chemotaxis protein CheD
VSFDGGPSRFEAGVSELLFTYSPIEPARRVYLAPGQLFAARDRVQVTTILGSCVAVCLFDNEAEVGGVNHFLLPYGLPPSPRFAEHAVPQLLSRVLGLGAARERLRAKLFGGACVLEALRSSSALGARNVEVARERLAAEGIPVVAEDTGGDLGRKLIFEIQTGSAWIRAIDANSRQ